MIHDSNRRSHTAIPRIFALKFFLLLKNESYKVEVARNFAMCEIRIAIGTRQRYQRGYGSVRKYVWRWLPSPWLRNYLHPKIGKRLDIIRRRNVHFGMWKKPNREKNEGIFLNWLRCTDYQERKNISIS